MAVQSADFRNVGRQCLRERLATPPNFSAV